MHVSTAKFVLGWRPGSSVDGAPNILEGQANRLLPDRVHNSLRPATEATIAEQGCVRTSPDKSPAFGCGGL